MSSADHRSNSIQVYHDPYLAEGATTVDAIVTISVRDTEDSPNPSADSTATGDESMSTPIPDLTLRLWTPTGARIVFIKQIEPTKKVLAHSRVNSGDQLGDYPLGSWSGEHREYHLQVEVEPAAVGRKKLAARLRIAAGDQVLGEGFVPVVWTSEPAWSTQIIPRVDTVRLRPKVTAADETPMDTQSTGTVLLRKTADVIAARVKPCLACGEPVRGRFCEACRYDSEVEWSVVVAADRNFYERVRAYGGADKVEFPPPFPERRIILQSHISLIGRSNRDQDVKPEIDVGIPPVDRGVSTQHAELRIRTDGLTVTDRGSKNGTSINDSDIPLEIGEETPLTFGDRIHVGGWTTITIHAQLPADRKGKQGRHHKK